MTTFLTEFTLVLSLQIFALIMPGPDYILVVSNATLHSRKHGIYTAIGIALGIGIQVIACLLGLAFIIKESALLFSIITWFCAGYLAYLGGRIIYQSLHPTETTVKTLNTNNYRHSIRQGLICNLLNPKALLFFLSLFTLVINEHTPLTWQLAYGIAMMLCTVSWFSLVSILVTHTRGQYYVKKVQHILQPFFGALLILYAILILWSP